MDKHECRACRGRAGDLVLDLGEQPASDYFPRYDEPGPDPAYPLQMWLCASCGLAQLLTDPTVPEEPKGTEPAALIAQAREAVDLVAAAGLLRAGARVAEYGSPHGGSWLDLLTVRGLTPVAGTAEADLIVDCFGMMHAANQAAALAERAARLAPGGVLLLQYHSLDAIIRHGQWNALRHGHYAYYSTTALTAMLAATGLGPRTAWQFRLYGGTVLLAARRADGAGGTADSTPGSTVGSTPGSTPGPDETIRSLLAAEARTGVTDPDAVRGLQRDVLTRAGALHSWLASQKAAGKLVLGYSAASRAVALLRSAGVDRDLLPAVADASPGKQGLRMPGTAIPIIGPEGLIARKPDAVVVFVSDLIPEVRKAYPEIEAAGAGWVDADSPGTAPQPAAEPSGA